MISTRTKTAATLLPASSDVAAAGQPWRGRLVSATELDGLATAEVTELLAAAGYAVVAPDYLGLGEGLGAHPYIDADSASSASIDALRAGRTLTERRGVRFAERVFVTGHSQGGQSTMAVGRELQRGADSRMRLGVFAPIAGPYAMSESLRAGLVDHGTVAKWSQPQVLRVFDSVA